MTMGVMKLMCFGLVFAALALTLVALAFATDHWVEYTFSRWAVKRRIAAGTVEDAPLLNDSFDTNPLMFTRSRGLFRTCYHGHDTNYLLMRPDVIGGHCLSELGYQLYTIEATSKRPPAFHTRKHLMRTHVAFLVCAILVLVVACLTGGAACWRPRRGLLLTAGIMAFVGAFFTTSGMAVFHGYEYLEKQIINMEMFPKGWPPVVTKNTDLQYGVSYIMAWIGMSLSVVAAIFYLWAAMKVAFSDYDQKRPFDEYHMKTSRCDLPAVGCGPVLAYVPPASSSFVSGASSFVSPLASAYVPPCLDYQRQYAHPYQDHRGYRY